MKSAMSGSKRTLDHLKLRSRRAWLGAGTLESFSETVARPKNAAQAQHQEHNAMARIMIWIICEPIGRLSFS